MKHVFFLSLPFLATACTFNVVNPDIQANTLVNADTQINANAQVNASVDADVTAGGAPPTAAPPPGDAAPASSPPPTHTRHETDDYSVSYPADWKVMGEEAPLKASNARSLVVGKDLKKGRWVLASVHFNDQLADYTENEFLGSSVNQMTKAHLRPLFPAGTTRINEGQGTLSGFLGIKREFTGSFARELPVWVLLSATRNEAESKEWVVMGMAPEDDFRMYKAEVEHFITSFLLKGSPAEAELLEEASS
ncbi:MAG: hypothetical protein ACLGIN_02445 [Candidatus Sericytochromatia bacterium]